MPGFSLIELIIVILIASLFAALIFSRVSFATRKQEKVGIRQLKKAGVVPPGDAQLICRGRCRRCVVVMEGKQSEIPSRFKELKGYILDDGGNPKEVDFGRIRDRKICLRFYYYANGSTSQMILESEGKFYFVPSYFGEIEAFDSLDGAVERWTHYRSQLDSMGTFF